MMLTVPVSVGEVIDKITILRIKKAKIANADKLVLIEKELSLLTESVNNIQCDAEQLMSLTDALSQINTALWDVEDCLRDYERASDFGAGFVGKARDVYHLNDRRFELKDSINKLVGSVVQEVKSYNKY